MSVLVVVFSHIFFVVVLFFTAILIFVVVIKVIGIIVVEIVADIFLSVPFFPRMLAKLFIE
jgi:hypothetical protein